LRAIGAAGGFCDGGGRESDASVEAGWPMFGQYIAHDLTADRSPLREVANVEGLANMRSPRANLESLYGGGPGGSPYMYERADPAKPDPAQLCSRSGRTPHQIGARARRLRPRARLARVSRQAQR
jgi:hypothetical protein